MPIMDVNGWDDSPTLGNGIDFTPARYAGFRHRRRVFGRRRADQRPADEMDIERDFHFGPGDG